MKEQEGINKTKLIDFFEDYETKNPIFIMLYMILSLGSYLILWIYSINQKFEEIDEYAPDSRRCIVILLLFPISWIFIILTLKYLIIPEFNAATMIINILGWSIITFLSLKYFYDFCESYSRITNSNALIWYLFLYPGYYSIILASFKFYYTLPLLFFTFMAIPAMQAFLNNFITKYKLHNIGISFNISNSKNYKR